MSSTFTGRPAGDILLAHLSFVGLSMSVLRIVGKIGIVVLALLLFVAILVAVERGDWSVVFLCVGFLAVLAKFYDTFRVEALREKMPHGSFAPSRKVDSLFFFVLIAGAILGGVARLSAGSYWEGAELLIVGLVLLGARR
jgi:hypothetical protein